MKLFNMKRKQSCWIFTIAIGVTLTAAAADYKCSSSGTGLILYSLGD
jgi:hypothetical protein